ncbi:TlpA family protein disulfide reductase [Sphingomonas lenta]|uniref:Redoxin family protein n=1 Tax=Sphingomonas lenta TaxID=1141887 RepID=A0A2A2SFY0_9SPHN|nr:TlpA disulfide reductase family protein [Sphingomonas lenta]PAX07921.1 redoxin family protein [Sphingomonas lenta]
MSSRPGVVLLLGSALVAAGCDKETQAPAQANSVASDEVASAPAPASAPKSGAFDRSRKGEAAPDVAFTAPDGKPVRLADFRGKPLLVNLWATWCAPCVAEMPTLDAAAGALGDRVRVLTVSQDLDGAAKVRPFFASRGFRHLQPYLDPEVGLSTAYGVNLPATILYDAQGREVWRRLGAYEWNSPEAARAIAEAA